MTQAHELHFRWNHAEDVAPAAAFAGRVIGAASSYISHGEIQTGLSDDGRSWVSNLERLYLEDFSDRGNRDLLVAHDAAGEVCGLLMLAWEASSRRRFAVIEDMAVDPSQRSQGIGKRMMDLAETRIREHGVEWVFLESGRDNEGAHHFFERAGFKRQSAVFARKL